MLSNFKNRSKKKQKFDNGIGKDKQEVEEKKLSKSLSYEQKIDYSFKLVRDIVEIPTKNQIHRIVTQRTINAFDFVMAIVKDEEIQDLTMCVYTVAKKIIQKIEDLQELGKINNITIATSTAIPKLTPDIYKQLMILDSSNKVNIKLCQTHAKIMIIKTKDNYYIIEGSGNLTQNQKIEQYIFENNKKVYDFHKQWIDEI